MTECDFFAVGHLHNGYELLTDFIAPFDEYRAALVEHLVEKKLGHWDEEIRVLAGKALTRLAMVEKSDHFRAVVLPRLLKECTDFDSSRRHGSLVAAARLFQTLQIAKEDDDELRHVLLHSSSKRL